MLSIKQDFKNKVNDFIEDNFLVAKVPDDVERDIKNFVKQSFNDIINNIDKISKNRYPEVLGMISVMTKYDYLAVLSKVNDLKEGKHK